MHMEIPNGNSPKDVAVRKQIISNFYREWKIANPSHRRFNLSLKDYISIRFVSITETCTHASRSYLSTLAVLQLDAILTYAKKIGEVPPKTNGNQKPFDKIIVMRYECPGIGTVKMTVGIRRGNHEKIGIIDIFGW